MFATDSFVYKFNQLWSAGHSAHLDLDTHAGRAWVGLRVQLGHHAPLPPFHLPHNFPQYSHKKDSPSRQRRRAKRAAAARQANADEASEIEEEVAVDVADNESAEEAIVDVDESRSINDAKTVEETDDEQNETLVGVADEALMKYALTKIMKLMLLMRLEIVRCETTGFQAVLFLRLMVLTTPWRRCMKQELLKTR